ncbi:hypothetical protein J6590_097741 [Homalodisca vitripennis]|nr:hypothetical protein J6590_097741 [Homalodisca vitripennis]
MNDITSRQQLSCAYPLLVETIKPRSATRDSGTTRFRARFKDWSRKTDKIWDESPPSLPFVDCRRRWCCHIATVRTVVTSHDKVKWSGREELFVALFAGVVHDLVVAAASVDLNSRTSLSKLNMKCVA